MKNLSAVEFIAILFAGLAGIASAVQAYVSWETRGEVSRAIVFAERIDACSKVLAALDPFVAKARAEGRERVARGAPDGRYSLNRYYYRMSSGNTAFDAVHGPRIEAWRVAAAAFSIVGPPGSEGRLAYLNKAIAEDIEAGKFMNQAEMLAWLERLEIETKALKQGCRSIM
ncbi:MAG: hypothetical protein AAGC70_11870 [Pseudomonadota bacterium]